MNIKAFIAATRIPFATASALPVIFTTLWVLNYQNIFSWPTFIVTLLGVVFFHLSANLLNDYFDWEGSDRVNLYAGPFSGGNRSKLGNILKRGSFLKFGFFFGMLGLLSLVYFLYIGRYWALLIAFIGALLGTIYSLPPFKLQARGLGEIAVLFAFGPLITFGTGYVLTGEFLLNHFLIGMPQGFLITSILWINEFPDFVADRHSGKKNLVVRLGLKNARFVYAFFVALAFVSIIVLIPMQLLPLAALTTLILFPLAMSNIKCLWKHFFTPKKLLKPQRNTIILHILVLVILIAVLGLRLVVNLAT